MFNWPHLPRPTPTTPTLPPLSRSRVCLSTQEASQPLNLTSKSKGLELRGKTPSPQALELGSLGLQGGFRPRDLQREVSHSPQRSALSKSCSNYHRTRSTCHQSVHESEISRRNNPFHDAKASRVTSILLSINFYFLPYTCSMWPPAPAARTTSVR